MQILRFDPHTADAARWSAWHRFRRAMAAELRPGDPLLSDAEEEIEEKIESPLWTERWVIAMGADGILGSASFGYRRPESEGAAAHAPYLGGGGSVRASHRRQGIGRALLEQARRLMHEMNKTVLTLSSFTEAGHAFLARIGAEARHSALQNRARFDTLDWAQLRAWEDGIRDHGLTWERHAGRVPMDRLEGLLPDFTRLIADIPLGTLERPPIRYEIEGYRQWYDTLDRTGGAHHVLLLRDKEGRVVGLTDTGWDPRTPDRVWQNLTATDRAWRGRGVARALKAAMFRQIRTAHPEVALMITFNAESNAPMLSINTRVGFKVHRRTVDYQVSRDALDAYLR